MGSQNAEKKKGACYPDKRKKEIKEFTGAGLVEGPDRMEVDKDAEAQPEEEGYRFNHGSDSNRSEYPCQHRNGEELNRLISNIR